MNNKGFTLVELIATIVILALIMGICFAFALSAFGDAKEKTEDVFVDTIEDAMDIYLSSDGKELNFSTKCNNLLEKKSGNVEVYKATVKFLDVINSKYRPITQNDLVNPANKDVDCNNANNISVNIYRDSDYVYYYSINKNSFGCLLNVNEDDGYSSLISNLPGDEVLLEDGKSYIDYVDLGGNCR